MSLTGQGGWPMTVFLTADGAPFFGGTYYPPEPRHGLPSFDSCSSRSPRRTASAAATWRSRLPCSSTRCAGAPRRRRRASRSNAASSRNRWQCCAAVRPGVGRLRRALKFPPASTIELLLRIGESEMATTTLDGTAAGGMWDVVGGGFHRYSVDETWLVPHFEKMLYDNALLVPAYLHGWLVTGNLRYREIAERTLDYMVRELRLLRGGFASSQDADTEGVEGLTYTWTVEEGAPPEPAAAVRARPLDHSRRPRRGDARPSARDSGAASAAAARRQGDRLVERSRARRARRGGAATRSRRSSASRARARRRCSTPTCCGDDARRARAASRLPRRLRERRTRAHRAARRDGRAALAPRRAAHRPRGGRALR